MIRFPRVRGARVKYNLSVHLSGRGIPIGRVSEVTDHFEVVNAVEVGKNLLGVGEKIRKDVVVVLRAAEDVTEEDVQLGWQMLNVHAEPPEASVGLVIQVVIQTVLATQLPHLRMVVKRV